MSERRFSVLDEFFLQIETPERPTHWALVFELEDGAAVSVAALRERVRERVGTYPSLLLGATDSSGSGPRLREFGVQDAVDNVGSATAADDAAWHDLLGSLLAQPLPRDRPSWRLVRVHQDDTGAVRLVLMVHHSLADGIAGAGYAGLFIDGESGQLAQLDRYLLSDRYAGPAVSPREFFSALKGFAGGWAGGTGSRRMPKLTGAGRRSVAAVHVPTGQVRAIAVRNGAGTAEYLIGAIGESLATLTSGHRVLRAFAPATLDRTLRHSGNAVSIVLVNVNGGDQELGERLTATRGQLDRIADSGAPLALPVISRAAGALPWVLRRAAARATLAMLGPDVHIGVNPGYLNLKTVFGTTISAVQPLSPLLGNAVSFTCLVLGKDVHIGIVWDPEAVGDLGADAARALAARLEVSAAVAP